MWFPLAFVAESRSVAKEPLAAFALAHPSQYGIVDDGTGPEISNWYVDAVERDFKSWSHQTPNPV